MKYIRIKGDYLEEEGKYLAVFESLDSGVVEVYSSVTGKTPNTSTYTLHDKIGYIKALLHALSWAESHCVSELTIICDDKSKLAPVLSKKSSAYTEIITAKRYLNNVSKRIKIHYVEEVVA